jgi:ABC-type Mn2+/Zn2+ transport system permease subunit
VEWLTSPFELAFQQRAVIGGSLAAISLAVVGTWVVIRGMAFLGDALAHGVVPGVALAVLIGIHPLLGASIAAAVMLIGVDIVHRQTRLAEDAGIGLLFVGMLAAGVILISPTAEHDHELAEILFGDALGVSGGDLFGLAAIAVVTLVMTLVLYRPFLSLAFNERKARILGLGPRRAHTIMLLLIMAAIVGSFQTVGTLLVFGLLIGPPATASLLVRRVPSMMITAAAIGVASVVVGLIISYHADTPAAATMALIPIVLFFVMLGTRRGVRHGSA